jgi:predicted amidohydrolase YtcJ
VDDRDSVARALAIEDGEIVFVGSNRGARRFTGSGTRVIDLEGRMVMPGLHEGHIHDVERSDQKTCATSRPTRSPCPSSKPGSKPV